MDASGTSTILDQGWTLVSTILNQGWTLWFKEQHTWQDMRGMAPRIRHESFWKGSYRQVSALILTNNY